MVNAKLETPKGDILGWEGRYIFIPIDRDMVKLREDVMCGQMHDTREIYVVDDWAYVPQRDGLALPFKVVRIKGE